MPSLLDSASAILSSAERRLETSAQNVANAATTGFKRQVSFTEALAGAAANSGERGAPDLLVDFTQGRLIETGNLYDLAVFGAGLFQLRDGERLIYSRGGSFVRGEDGVLADSLGRVLQQAGGGDLTLRSDAVTILGDGTVLEDNLPTARLALYDAGNLSALTALGGSAFAADPAGMEESAGSQVRQGFLENSNVVTSDEMIAAMASIRRAEGGGRLVQIYDQLIGQAITTFSRSGK